MSLEELFDEKSKLTGRLRAIDGAIRMKKKRRGYFNCDKNSVKCKTKRPKLDHHPRTSHLIRVRLYCSHCRNYFYAKPTKRDSLYVLNHECSGEKRKQYVVGRHHRRCTFDHPPEVACIDFAPQVKEEEIWTKKET